MRATIAAVWMAHGKPSHQSSDPLRHWPRIASHEGDRGSIHNRRYRPCHSAWETGPSYCLTDGCYRDLLCRRRSESATERTGGPRIEETPSSLAQLFRGVLWAPADDPRWVKPLAALQLAGRRRCGRLVGSVQSAGSA
jgi:hypothetical protein